MIRAVKFPEFCRGCIEMHRAQSTQECNSEETRDDPSRGKEGGEEDGAERKGKKGEKKSRTLNRPLALSSWGKKITEKVGERVEDGIARWRRTVGEEDEVRLCSQGRMTV